MSSVGRSKVKSDKRAHGFQNISRVDGAKKAELLQGTWIWFEDPDMICVPAEVSKNDGTKVTLRLYNDDHPGAVYRDDEIVQVEVGQLDGCTAADPTYLDGVSNMIHLGDFHLGAILHNLIVRLRKKQIYTHIGNILVAMNPYEKLPLYTSDQMALYMKFVPEMRVGPEGGRVGYEDDLPPHIFQVAKAAYTEMMELSQNQSIVISGESGAGKTETTKFILSFLAEYTSQGTLSTVERQILESSPILESFGNATTLRNNNSSRFGKWTEIYFDVNGRISGARITNYLLEKVRVVRPTKGERNYHIFYYLCAGAVAQRGSGSDPLWQELNLGTAADYKFLNQSGSLIKVEGIDDLKEFEHVNHALKVFNMSDTDRSDLFRILAGILHLGNVEFVDDGKDGSKVSDKSKAEIENACALFGVELSAFEKAVCYRVIGAGTSAETVKPRTPAESTNARDGIAKLIYSELFDWIVQRLNSSISKEQQQSGEQQQQSSYSHYASRFIGVLDIYGFEVFESNSFEQLCINYANEKLQQHFNRYIFKEEQKAAAQEDIDFAGVQFEDNQHTIDLFEESDGIFQLLDQSLLMNGTDRSFLNNLANITANKHKNSFYIPKTAPDTFGVHHYAGDVPYAVSSFIEKNRDTIDPELIALVQGGRTFLRSLFQSEEYVALTSNSSARQLQGVSLAKRYQCQLRDLMTAIEATVPHFVRCVKPNAIKRPMLVDPLLTVQQLKYAGFLEAIRIRRLGYPVRRPFAAFVHRYGVLNPERTQHKRGELRQACIDILERVKSKINIGPPVGVQVGIRRVFLKQEHMDILEDERQKALLSMVVTLQKATRSRRARKGFRDNLHLHRQMVRILALPQRDFEEMLQVAQKVKQVGLANAVSMRFLASLLEAESCLAKIKTAQQNFDLKHLEELLGVVDRLGLTLLAASAREFQQKTTKMLADLDTSLEQQNLDLLESSLRTCRELKYTSQKVEQATALRDRLRKEMPLDDALKRAIASQKRVDLETALEQADSLKYQSPASDEARLLLARLLQRDKVKADIVSGLAARDLDLLESALVQARAVGLAGDKTVQEAEKEAQTLRGEWEVLKALRAAAAGEDAGELRECIVKAEDIGLDSGEIAKARTAFDALLRKSGVMDDLRRAISSRKRAELEDAISKARAARLGDTDEVQRAETVLERVKAEEECMRNVDIAIAEMSLEKLERAVETLEREDIKGERVKEANALLRDWRETFQLLNEALSSRKLTTIQLALSHAHNLRLYGLSLVKEVEALETQVEREGWALNQLKLAISRQSIDRLTEALTSCRSVGVSETLPEMMEASALCATLFADTKSNLETANASIQAKDLEIEAHKQRLSHANDRLVEVQKDKDGLKQKLDDTQSQLGVVTLQLQERERVGRSLADSLQLTESEKQSANLQLTATRLESENHVRRIAELERANAALQAEVATTHEKLLIETSRTKAKDMEIHDMAAHAKQELESHNILQVELNRRKGEIEIVTQQLNFEKSVVADLTKTKTELTTSIETLNGALREKDVIIFSLQSQVVKEKEKELASQLSYVQQQSEVEKQVAKLQSELNTKKFEWEASDQRLKLANERIGELTAQKSEVMAQKADTEAKLQDSMLKIQKLQADLMQSREGELHVQSKLGKAELEIETEKRSRASAEERIIDLEGDLARTRKQLIAVETERDSEKSHVQQANAQLQETRIQLADTITARDALQTQLKQQLAEAEKLREQCSDAVQHTERLERQISELEKKIEDAEQHNTVESASKLEIKLALESQLQQERERVANLEAKMDRKQAEMDQLTLNVHMLTAHAGSLEDECESLKQTVAVKTQNEQKIKVSTPSLQGWLRKEGGGFGSVKRRYFVLKADCLFYYESADPAEKPLGVVPLLGVDVRGIGKKGHGFAFEILPRKTHGKLMSSKRGSTGAMVQGSHTSLVLYAESEKSSEEWVSALSRSVNENLGPQSMPPATPSRTLSPPSILLDVPDC